MLLDFSIVCVYNSRKRIYSSSMLKWEFHNLGGLMDFLEEIRGKYDTLSTVQKRIADYLFTYPEEVCFQSLKEVSESLGVTEVTILRFAKKVGAGSFVELKKRMKEYLQSRLDRESVSFRVVGRVGVTLDESMDKEYLYKRFVENELSVVKNTYSKNQLERILNAVSLIKQARTVYVVGNELGTAAAAYLTRRLLTIGVHAMDLSSVTRAIYNNYMAHTGAEDVVILFSTPGYAKYLVNTTKYLEKKNVPQIVITDKENAPVAASATEILVCDNHDLYFYNSVLGFFSISNALAYFAAMHDLEETTRLRAELAETREAIGYVGTVN